MQVMVTHTNGMTVLYENNWVTPADFEGRSTRRARRYSR
jgi:hypothetical protein